MSTQPAPIGNVHFTHDSPKDINLSDIELDIGNPRIRGHIRQHKIKLSKTKYNHQKLMDIYDIEFRAAVDHHYSNVRDNGLLEQLYVKKSDRKGKYVVKEGNVRTVILNKLVDGNIKPISNHVNYKKVRCMIYHDDVSDATIAAHILTLQEGRFDWGSFEVALDLAELRDTHNYTIPQIARIWNKEPKKIQNQLDTLKEFDNFDKWHQTSHHSKSPAPRKLWSKIETGLSKKNIKDNLLNDGNIVGRKHFFDIITQNEQNKMKLTDTKKIGQFAQLADNPNLVKKFVKDRTMGLDEILDEYKAANPEKGLGWVSKAKVLTGALHATFNNTADMNTAKKSAKIKTTTKELLDIIKDVHEKIEHNGKTCNC
jgi:hypothetical protein